MRQPILLIVCIAFLVVNSGCATMKNTTLPYQLDNIGACPHCKKGVNIGEFYDTDSVVCPNCNKTFKVSDSREALKRKYIDLANKEKMKSFCKGVLIGTLIVAAAAASAYGNSRSYAPSYPTYTTPTYSTPSIPSYGTPMLATNTGTYLGQLSTNRYAYNSTSNPYGSYGSPYSATSINNPSSQYGSKYSSTSVNNPYTTNAPKIYASDGTYLGKLSSNQYDYESVSNPYGPYGSKYSATSIKNPYSQYGSRYSSQSPNNPYTTDAPAIIGQ